MINQAVLIYIAFMSITLFSCTGKDVHKKKDYKNGGNDKNIRYEKHVVSFNKFEIKMDSAIITCLMFGLSNDISFQVKYSPSKFKLVNWHNKDKSISLTLKQLDEFLDFLKIFYIKKEPVMLIKKVKQAPISDYPVIMAIGFSDGKKLFDEKTTINNKAALNPKFLEFYKFLESLVTSGYPEN